MTGDRSGRVAWGYLLVCLVVTVGSRWLPDNGKVALLSLVQLSGGLAVLAGARRHRPAHRTGWSVLGASGVLFGLGVGCWFLYTAVLGRPFPYPGWPDAFFVPAYLALAGGLALLLRRRSPGRQVPALLDALILAVGLAYANWVFLTGPAFQGMLTTGQHVLTIAYPLIDVVIVAVAVRLLLIAGVSSVSLWLLSVGVFANLGGDTAYAVLARTGSYQTGALPDQLWMLALMLIGAAALHPSMGQVAVQVETDREGTGRLRLVLLMVAMQIPIDVTVAQALTGGEVEVRAAALALGLLTLLAMARFLHLASSLRGLALTDDLTGLANREALRNRLAGAAETRRDPGRSALLFIDLDHFKNVNDTLGHHIGDRVLVAVAGRLRDLVRAQDALWRLGGDEFAVLREDLQSAADAEVVADRVIAVLSQPFNIEGHELFLGASVGLVHLDGNDPATVLRDADAAMYTAKTAGRACWAVFAPEMVETLTSQVRLDTDLRHALGRGELRVVFQPVSSLLDGEVVGVEALLRWRHPVHGEISPTLTIPALERTGLIQSVGRWVLGEALHTMAASRAAGHGRRLMVAVNVSARQFDDPAFTVQVAAELAATRTDPADLCLEVTETALVDDHLAFSGALTELARMGIHIALDDFGTGYSTLAQVAQLPVDVIKIDLSFVHRLHEPGGRHRTLTAALIDMATALGMDVIAEGVETVEQADLLRSLGCRKAQGFLFAEPLEAGKLARLLEQKATGATKRPAFSAAP